MSEVNKSLNRPDPLPEVTKSTQNVTSIKLSNPCRDTNKSTRPVSTKKNRAVKRKCSELKTFPFNTNLFYYFDAIEELTVESLMTSLTRHDEFIRSVTYNYNELNRDVFFQDDGANQFYVFLNLEFNDKCPYGELLLGTISADRIERIDQSLDYNLRSHFKTFYYDRADLKKAGVYSGK